jgi:hypothetical protein
LNIVDPHCVTQSGYLDAYRRRHHRRTVVVRLPFGVVVRGARCIEGVLKPTGLKFPVSEYRLRSAIGPRVFSCEAVSRYLGEWRYTGIQDYLCQPSVQDGKHP